MAAHHAEQNISFVQGRSVATEKAHQIGISKPYSSATIY